MKRTPLWLKHIENRLILFFSRMSLLINLPYPIFPVRVDTCQAPPIYLMVKSMRPTIWIKELKSSANAGVNINSLKSPIFLCLELIFSNKCTKIEKTYQQELLLSLHSTMKGEGTISKVQWHLAYN